MAYNLYRLFVLKVLEKGWHGHQVQTVRWRLYAHAGKIVFHGGQTFLIDQNFFAVIFRKPN